MNRVPEDSIIWTMRAWRPLRKTSTGSLTTPCADLECPLVKTSKAVYSLRTHKPLFLAHQPPMGSLFCRMTLCDRISRSHKTSRWTSSTVKMLSANMSPQLCVSLCSYVELKCAFGYNWAVNFTQLWNASFRASRFNGYDDKWQLDDQASIASDHICL